MHLHPTENPGGQINSLVHQFRTKGYDCQEIHDHDTILFIMTYEKNMQGGVSRLALVPNAEKVMKQVHVKK